MATAKAKSARMGKMASDNGARGGFTIIEVVLVLAIAGLIFMMVFLALPALQRSQRDTQRRTTVGSLYDALLNYQTNNNGRLPANDTCNKTEETAEGVIPFSEQTNNSACSLIKNYLNGAGATNNEFADPLGYGYGLTITTDEPGAVDDFDMMVYVYKGAACDGEVPVRSNNSRDFAIVMKLEGSGTYCQSNNGGGTVTE